MIKMKGKYRFLSCVWLFLLLAAFCTGENSVLRKTENEGGLGETGEAISRFIAEEPETDEQPPTEHTPEHTTESSTILIVPKKGKSEKHYTNHFFATINVFTNYPRNFKLTDFLLNDISPVIVVEF